MISVVLIAIFGAWAVFKQQTITEVATDLPQKISEKLEQLWDVAQESLRDRKYLRAEKALLTILRVDERNATAYNRLGILYAKQQAYKDAIECFEIAQSLEPSASSLHNVGLIYYETKKYEKAALAFEQALAMESDLAARHVAYAKVQEKLGHTKKMIQSLETALKIEETPQVINILADAYDRTGQTELAAKLHEKAAKMLTPAAPKTNQIRQVRRVM